MEYWCKNTYILLILVYSFLLLHCIYIFLVLTLCNFNNSQFHTMRNVLYMAMTEFRKVRLLLFLSFNYYKLRLNCFPFIIIIIATCHFHLTFLLYSRYLVDKYESLFLHKLQIDLHLTLEDLITNLSENRKKQGKCFCRFNFNMRTRNLIFLYLTCQRK